jgi:hypothetical protein
MNCPVIRRYPRALGEIGRQRRPTRSMDADKVEYGGRTAEGRSSALIARRAASLMVAALSWCGRG